MPRLDGAHLHAVDHFRHIAQLAGGEDLKRHLAHIDDDTPFVLPVALGKETREVGVGLVTVAHAPDESKVYLHPLVTLHAPKPAKSTDAKSTPDESGV